MGLNEKRATIEFQTNEYPTLQARIAELAGQPIPLEVSWEEIAEPGYSHKYTEAWTKIFFTPLIDALAQLTSDPYGKEAVGSGLKVIKLRSSGSNKITFDAGMLTIDQRFSNFESIVERTTAVTKALEAGL